MMTSPLERLAGPGQPLAAEPPDAKEFESLKRSGLARRLVRDLITACRAVAAKLERLPRL
jgi:hypothetical protein